MVSVVRRNWHSIASVYIPKNIHPCLMSLEGTKKQQAEHGKMGEGLKPMQKFFYQDEANPANLGGCRLSVFT